MQNLHLTGVGVEDIARVLAAEAREVALTEFDDVRSRERFMYRAELLLQAAIDYARQRQSSA